MNNQILTSSAFSPAKKYPTPFWVHGEYKAKCGISGRIAGKHYCYNAKTKQVFKRVDSAWVQMTQAELEAKPYIKDTLREQYLALDSIKERFARRDYRKRQYLAAVKAWNH